MAYNSDKSSYRSADVIFKKTPQEYISVNTRLQEFREKFEGYRLVNTILKLEDGFVLIKSEILDPDGNVVSTGHAYEREGSSYINKTSYIENCETSAVGRALAFLGIRVGEAIASREEVENAKLQQQEKPTTQSVVAETEASMQDIIDKTMEYIVRNRYAHPDFDEADILKKFEDKYGSINLKKLKEKL